VTRIVVGAAEQTIAYELRTALDELEDVSSVYVVESTAELVAAVLRLDPDVVLVHDQLGPEPALQVVRDLALRRPTCAALIITLAPTTETLAAAMDAGARGIVGHPVTFEELTVRVAAARDWGQQMRRLMSARSGADNLARGLGRVVTLVGAKGGVGVTTIATHLAMDLVRTVPGHRVCLVDLDLEKGDVSGVLDVRHRASIADVAKVSQDLSAQAVSDAVLVHESGVHLLLTPADVREVEVVNPRALREVLAVLRNVYDLVLIDAGSHVTPAQAAVVEAADEVVVVTTPDVLAMRGLRRSVTQWENLGVRKETDLRVLVNRLSRATLVSADTVRRLTRAPVLSVGLPSVFRRLEPALNSRDPLAIRDEAWWRTLRAIGHEIGLVLQPERAGTAAAELTGAGRTRAGRSRSKGRSRGLSGRKDDAGSITVETVGIIPTALAMVVLLWQVGVYGMSMVWSAQAANAASRALAVGTAPGQAARGAVPGSVASRLTVTPDGPSTSDSVTVTYHVPLFAPGGASLPLTVSTTRQVVREP
jgi:pilus assembly protein CpaE